MDEGNLVKKLNHFDFQGRSLHIGAWLKENYLKATKSSTGMSAIVCVCCG